VAPVPEKKFGVSAGAGRALLVRRQGRNGVTLRAALKASRPVPLSGTRPFKRAILRLRAVTIPGARVKG
jgi:hypothetical protein